MPAAGVCGLVVPVPVFFFSSGQHIDTVPSDFWLMDSVTLRAFSFENHGASAVDGREGVSVSLRGGIDSSRRRFVTPSSMWYWCHATRHLR